jgi:hypothetical protein
MDIRFSTWIIGLTIKYCYLLKVVCFFFQIYVEIIIINAYCVIAVRRFKLKSVPEGTSINTLKPEFYLNNIREPI